VERHRIVVAVVIAVAPIAGLIAFGCSSDTSGNVGMTQVDPGGTFGAEVSLQVVGRGRVVANIPSSIDCPGNCYVRYTFNSSTDRGAADGLTLNAIATTGARFVGWKFEADQLATKGRGPDSCNPVKRATSQPGDSNSTELKLAYGQVAGTAPAGQEGACGGDQLQVPLAYKLTATFADDSSFDAGYDAGDAGSPGTVLFESPVAGATGGDLYLVNGRLYWRFNSGGFQGIASGLTSTISPTPQVVVSATSTIPKFEGDYQNVMYQQGTSTLGVFNSSNPTLPLTSFTSMPGPCDALESYYSPNTVFCLYAGTMYSWNATSGGARTTVVGSVPATAGRNFAAAFSYFWIVNDPGGAGTASIQQGSRSAVDNDGGTITWTPTITARTNPQKLQTNSSDYLFWIESNPAADLAEVHSSTGSSTTYTPIPAESGVKFISPDPSSSYIVAGVSPTLAPLAGKIYRTLYYNSSIVTPAVSGIPNLTGLANDSTYYYWTQNDGRVYRHIK
jgi:hypothetical protein